MHVSKQFVDQLFADDYFMERLVHFGMGQKVQLRNNDTTTVEQKPIKLDQVIDEISLTLYQGFKQAISKQCNYLYESNTFILNQLQTLKSKLTALPSHQTTPPSSQHDKKHQLLSTSIFFDPDNDLNQIRQNMNSLQAELQDNHKSLIHSFQLYEENYLHKNQEREVEFEIDEKVNERIREAVKKVEEEIKARTDKFQLSIDQRVEQLKKTITKVVEAMSDPHFWFNNNNPELLADHQKLNSTHQNPHSDVDSPSKLNKTFNHSIMNDNKFPSPSNSNKTIDTLNKSFNFGKIKIKSLFGFKASPKPTNQPVL